MDHHRPVYIVCPRLRRINIIAYIIIIYHFHYYRDRQSVETIITYYYYYLSLTTSSVWLLLHNCGTPQVMVRYVCETANTHGEYFPGRKAINYLIHTLLLRRYMYYCNKRILCTTTTPLIIIILYRALTCHHRPV